MGSASGGNPATLDIEELLATRLLVQGNSGSGKSHLLRRLLEQSAQWVQQVIIDPEGDFVTLSDKFGHVVVDGERTEAELAGIANRIRQHRVSCVLTLEGLEVEQQMRAAAAFLNGMFDADREFWYPVLVVVDEAQMFAPSVAGEVSDDARKMSLGAMTNLMCRGRKRGLAGVIATQRLAKLAKNVAAEASNFLMGRTFLDIDMARAADLLGMDRRQAEMFRDLKRGNFVALGPASVASAAADPDRQCRDVGSFVEPEADAAAGFAPGRRGPDLHAGSGRVPAADRAAPRRRHGRPPIFWPSCHAPHPRPARRSLSRAGPASRRCRRRPRGTAVPPCFTRSSMIRAPASALMQCSTRNSSFDFACDRVPGSPMSLPEFRRRVAVSRSGVNAETAETEAWAMALSLSSGVTDDLQGVFLMLAKAADQRRAMPVGCPYCPGLRHAFRTSRPASARLFRGAGHRRRAHGFLRQADRRVPRHELPDGAWRCQCG
jgi:hypothetical protein